MTPIGAGEPPEVAIRRERGADRAAVDDLLRRAFPTAVEARLVAALRGKVEPWIALVAERAGAIAGHALFTPVTVDGARGALALGPLAVLPELQRRGIGSRLVRAGLDACRAAGAPAVFVLGDAAYYPRFGFEPAAPRGLRYRSADFDAHFFVLELAPRGLQGLAGEVRYHPLFDDA